MSTEQDKTSESSSLLDDCSDHELQIGSGVVMENSSLEISPLVKQEEQKRLCSRKCCSSTGKRVLRWLKKNLLLVLTVISVIVGVIIGLSVRTVDMPRDSNGYRVMVEVLGFPGEIFLRMLKMLILPLIVFSLIAGLGSLEAKVAGSLGWKTVLYYFSTTFLAIVVGLILVSLIKPGGGRDFTMECDNSTRHSMSNNLDTLDSILDLIRNMLPDNLFAATFQQAETSYLTESVTDYNACLSLYNMSSQDVTSTLSSQFSDQSNSTSAGSATCVEIQEFIRQLNLSCENTTRTDQHYRHLGTREGMNVLGIIIFTIAFGITLGRQGEGGRKIVQAIGVLNEAIMKLVNLIMWYSPIGIAFIIAGKLAEVDSFANLVKEIGLYFVTVMVGLFIHGCITLPLLYTIMTRSNPLKLVRAVLQALLTAFGTSSSSATLPITLQNLEQNFKADPRVTRFMLPIGATINMDGTALYEAVAAVFISQVEGHSFNLLKLIIISITATLASVGAAGIPQAGLFTLVIVLMAVGLNPENIGLILAVDWLLDRFRTTVNVLGDSFGVGIVNHYSRKQLGPLPPVSQNSSNSTESLDQLAARHSKTNPLAPPPHYGSSSPPLDDSLHLSASSATSPLALSISSVTGSEPQELESKGRLEGTKEETIL